VAGGQQPVASKKRPPLTLVFLLPATGNRQLAAAKSERTYPDLKEEGKKLRG